MSEERDRESGPPWLMEWRGEGEELLLSLSLAEMRILKRWAAARPEELTARIERLEAELLRRSRR